MDRFGTDSRLLRQYLAVYGQLYLMGNATRKDGYLKEGKKGAPYSSFLGIFYFILPDPMHNLNFIRVILPYAAIRFLVVQLDNKPTCRKHVLYKHATTSTHWCVFAITHTSIDFRR
jgi:hypothetical protein